MDAATGSGAAYADVRVVEHQAESLTVKNGSLAAVLQRPLGRLRGPGPGGRRLGIRLEPGPRPRPRPSARRAERWPSPAPAGWRAGRRSCWTTAAPRARRPGRRRSSRTRSRCRSRTSCDILFDADAAMARAPGRLAARDEHGGGTRSQAVRLERRCARDAGPRLLRGGRCPRPRSTSSESQERSYPKSLGGQVVGGGIRGHPRDGPRRTTASASARRRSPCSTRPQCPSGEMDVILEASQVAIQVHESCGHPTELDRVLGMEASFAGTSFLTTDRLDRFQYGSPMVQHRRRRHRARRAGDVRLGRRGRARPRTCRWSAPVDSSATSPRGRRRRSSAADPWAAADRRAGATCRSSG